MGCRPSASTVGNGAWAGGVGVAGAVVEVASPGCGEVSGAMYETPVLRLERDVWGDYRPVQGILEMTHFGERLAAAILKKGNSVTVGLDPRDRQLPMELLERARQRYSDRAEQVAAAF